MLMSRYAAWRAVVEAYQTCNQRYARLMKRFDLTSSQFDVLFVIESLGDQASPKNVATGLLVTMGNVTSVTRRLLERGLVEQVANAVDKRSVQLRLTEQGSALLSEAKASSKLFVEHQLSPFSEEEVEVVGRLMQRMRAHLESNEFQQSLEQIVQESSPGATL